MLVSVPHTGTRTLAKHLGETSFWHFGQNDADIEKRPEHIDFPVRDPLDSYVSWVCFEGGDGNHGGFFHRWELAIAYLSTYEHGVTYHKIEELPVLDGRGPQREHWLRALVKTRNAMALLQPELFDFFLWMGAPEIQDFFNRFYPGRFYAPTEITEQKSRELWESRARGWMDKLVSTRKNNRAA